MYFGILPLLIGIGLGYLGYRLFRSAGTDVVPFRNISAFVVAGFSHFTSRQSDVSLANACSFGGSDSTGI